MTDANDDTPHFPVRTRKMQHRITGQKYTVTSCVYCGFLTGNGEPVPDCGTDAPVVRGALHKPCGLYPHGHISMAKLLYD